MKITNMQLEIATDAIEQAIEAANKEKLSGESIEGAAMGMVNDAISWRNDIYKEIIDETQPFIDELIDSHENKEEMLALEIKIGPIKDIYRETRLFNSTRQWNGQTDFVRNGGIMRRKAIEILKKEHGFVEIDRKKIQAELILSNEKELNEAINDIIKSLTV